MIEFNEELPVFDIDKIRSNLSENEKLFFISPNKPFI
jgi:hypothetical protein